MKQKIVIILFLLTAFCAVSVSAQKTEKEKSNLRGTWEFEKLNSADGMLVADKNSENIKVFHQVVIEQKEAEVKIGEKIRYEFVNPKTKKSVVSEGETTATYFTDGRGETNTIDKKTANSTTKWKGNVLSISFYDSKTKNVVGTVEWKISKDGNTLTSIKQEKNPRPVAPMTFILNPLNNNRTTFARKS